MSIISIEEIGAIIAERCADNCAKLSEEYFRKAADLASEAKFLRGKNRKLAKKIQFRKKNAKFFIQGNLVFWFLAGIAVCVIRLFELRGPTMTAIETLGATLLYVAFGALLSIVMADLARGIITGSVSKFERLRAQNNERLATVVAKKIAATKDAEELRQKSRDNERESSRLRGLT